MRKSHMLATLIAVALIGLLFFAWSLVSKPSRKTTPEPDAGSQALEVGPTPEKGAELESAIESSRADVSSKPERDAPGSNERPLRIRVRYASGIDEHPHGLVVGVSNRTGTLFKPRRVEPNDFELVAGAPDAYIVRVEAEGFRAAVVRAQLSLKQPETRVEVVLVSKRTVSVRWRTEDGRPILVGVARAPELTGPVRLHVYATKFRPSNEPPLDRHALDVLRRELVVTESEHDGRVVFEKRAEWTVPEAIDERTASDVFGKLKFDEDGVIWASAFLNGVLLASQPIDEGQSEVEFVTSLSGVSRDGGAIELAVVDDLTGQPIEGASLRVESVADACVSDAAGRISCASLPLGRRRGILRKDDYADTTLQFTVRAGAASNLETVRMEAAHPAAFFRVVDAQGGLVVGLGFELAAEEVDSDENQQILTTYYALSTANGEPAASSSGTNLHFKDVQRGRYLLRCKANGVDATPLPVGPSNLRAPPNRSAIATIVVEPAFKASFVLDPPFARGTEVRIETQSGLPLRELEVDEYGIATTEILAGRYRLHLVEHGHATGAVDVLVDANPFVFEIHR